MNLKQFAFLADTGRLESVVWFCCTEKECIYVLYVQSVPCRISYEGTVRVQLRNLSCMSTLRALKRQPTEEFADSTQPAASWNYSDKTRKGMIVVWCGGVV